MLLKHWVLLFYECLIVVLMILSISEYPIYKFYTKTSTSIHVNNIKQILTPVVELHTNVLSVCLLEDVKQLSQAR